MTLAELRKKYVGKRVSDLYINQRSIPIDLDADPDYQYVAEVTIDDDRKITRISRMTGRRLVGDDATHVNYENIRINADDYDLIEDKIESLLDPDEVIEEKSKQAEDAPKTDEEELREAVKELETLENVARRASFHVNTEYTRKRIKELMQKMAENEHRFFKIVEEYDSIHSRYTFVLQEKAPGEQ